MKRHDEISRTSCIRSRVRRLIIRRHNIPREKYRNRAARSIYVYHFSRRVSGSGFDFTYRQAAKLRTKGTTAYNRSITDSRLVEIARLDRLDGPSVAIEGIDSANDDQKFDPTPSWTLVQLKKGIRHLHTYGRAEREHTDLKNRRLLLDMVQIRIIWRLWCTRIVRETGINRRWDGGVATDSNSIVGNSVRLNAENWNIAGHNADVMSIALNGTTKRVLWSRLDL